MTDDGDVEVVFNFEEPSSIASSASYNVRIQRPGLPLLLSCLAKISNIWNMLVPDCAKYVEHTEEL